MGWTTTVFSSQLGDVVLPISRTTIDGVNAGSNVPLLGLNVGGATVLTGAVSGSGFVNAVQAIIGGDALPSFSRMLNLTDVKTATGLPIITATAATTLPGISQTSGTAIYLTGAATSGATPATTYMLWEFNLPTTYVNGTNIPAVINCVVPTATDVTAASTTMTVAAYSVSAAGVETALTVSAAQQIPITTAAALTFTITGTGLVVGEHIILELTSLVTTTSGGASSVQVNSVSYTA